MTELSDEPVDPIATGAGFIDKIECVVGEFGFEVANHFFDAKLGCCYFPNVFDLRGSAFFGIGGLGVDLMGVEPKEKYAMFAHASLQIVVFCHLQYGSGC